MNKFKCFLNLIDTFCLELDNLLSYLVRMTGALLKQALSRLNLQII